jgi:hypothetical protein
MDARSADSRRRALLVVVASAVLGAALIVVARRHRPELEAWVRADPGPRARLVMAALALALAGPLLAVSLWLWRRGGQDAARGRWLRVVAVLLGLATLVLAWMLWRLAGLLAPA